MSTTSQDDVSLPYWKIFVLEVLGKVEVWGTQAGTCLTQR